MPIGALQQSLSGRTTYDIRNYKKTWALEWTFRKSDEYVMLESMFHGLSGQPVRFMDGRRRNLFPMNIAAGGSAVLDTDGWSLTSGIGTMAFSTTLALPTELAGKIAGGIACATLAQNNTLQAVYETIPLLQGSSYRFSGYIAGTGTVQAFAQRLSATGAVLGTTDFGSAITLTGSYVPFEKVFAPVSGDAAAWLGFRVTSTGTSAITTTGWMTQLDEAKKGWLPGAGCPEVLVTKFQRKYYDLPYIHATATIQEA
jgi:hypothetical protein